MIYAFFEPRIHSKDDEFLQENPVFAQNRPSIACKLQAEIM